ncbi:MAG: hypothetical protein KBD12_02010, partial [Candidatus Pacebacteria bacterium]|nr:hypothetical protein [Candidatus Paceibacterota bacterium]
LSGNTLTTTINGVVATSSVISDNTINYAAGVLTTSVNGVTSTTSIVGLLPTTTNVLSSATNTLTSTVNGLISSSSIINTNVASSSNNVFQVITNGISSTIANIINNFSQTSTGNTLTTIINGLSSSTPIINTSVASSSGNLFQTVINGISSSVANIINSNILSVSTSTNGTTITSSINNVNSSTTFSTINSNTVATTTNTLQTIVNGVSSAVANIINSFSQTLSGNTLTTTINGVTSTTPVISSNTINYAAGIISSTVNGVQATTSIVGLLPTTTNVLSSATNTLTSTVNGVTSSALIINSNNISFATSTNIINFSINGVVATTTIGINGTYLPLAGGTLTGNLTGTNANFSGNVGIGRTDPVSKLNVYDNLDNSAINVRAYTGGLDIQNGNGTAGAYSLLRFGNYESGTPIGGADGSYIQSITNGNNNTDLAFGNYQTGSGGIIREIMRLTQSGNVGIGTTTPAYKLSVAGDLKVADGYTVYLPNTVVINSQRGGAIQGSLNIHSIDSSNPTLVTLTRPTSPGTAGLTFAVGTDSQAYFNTSNADYIFQTSGTERMRLNTSGNLGIGTATP